VVLYVQLKQDVVAHIDNDDPSDASDKDSLGDVTGDKLYNRLEDQCHHQQYQYHRNQN